MIIWDYGRFSGSLHWIRRITPGWRHRVNEKSDQAPLISSLPSNALSFSSLKQMVLGFVLAMLLLGHCFGGDGGPDIWRARSGQPKQMWSHVGYDQKLLDTFFKSHSWGYPARPEDTARCYSTGGEEKHVVELCEARLIDANTLDLLIYHTCPSFFDKLLVRMRTGMFTCQYSAAYKAPGRNKGLIWTTKRQELTLDKKLYRKGDVIKGKIDFECVEESTDPASIEKWEKYPTNITMYGVFKTIVQ